MKTENFLNSLKIDEEIIDKFKAIDRTDPKNIYEFAKGYGLTDSYEDFVSECTRIKDEYLKNNNFSEEELKAVAGGCGLKSYERRIIIGAGSGIGGMIAAAVAGLL